MVGDNINMADENTTLEKNVESTKSERQEKRDKTTELNDGVKDPISAKRQERASSAEGLIERLDNFSKLVKRPFEKVNQARQNLEDIMSLSPHERVESKLDRAIDRKKYQQDKLNHYQGRSEKKQTRSDKRSETDALNSEIKGVISNKRKVRASSAEGLIERLDNFSKSVKRPFEKVNQARQDFVDNLSLSPHTRVESKFQRASYRKKYQQDKLAHYQERVQQEKNELQQQR